MKKLLAIATAAAMLTACNLDDNTAYETVPEINDVSFTPELEKITVDDNVLVQADISNSKGAAYVCLLYQTGNDLVSARAGKVNQTELITIPEGTDNFAFSATIPQQPEGKYVVCSIYCLNSYGIGSYSDQFVYKVLSAYGNIDYSQIVLNEIDGNRCFIEIHNRGTEDIILSRCSLHIDETYVAWTAADGTELRSGAYIVLESDSDDGFTGTITSDKNICIELTSPDGTVIDRFVRGEKGTAGWGVTTLPKHSEYSFSRCPNGTGDWAYALPTKGAYNSDKADDIENIAISE